MGPKNQRPELWDLLILILIQGSISEYFQYLIGQRWTSLHHDRRIELPSIYFTLKRECFQNVYLFSNGIRITSSDVTVEKEREV